MKGDHHPDKVALEEAREQVIAKLAECFARDEIGLDAFEARVNDAYAATASAQFDALVKDLGGAPQASSVTALARLTAPTELVDLRGEQAALLPIPARRVVSAVLGSIERRGALRVEHGTKFRAVLGNLELDLREATLPPGVTEIHVSAVLGNVEITVPSDLNVAVDGSGILGNFESSVRPLRQGGSPRSTLVIVGRATLGSINVHSRPPARVELLVRELREHSAELRLPEGDAKGGAPMIRKS